MPSGEEERLAAQRSAEAWETPHTRPIPPLTRNGYTRTERVERHIRTLMELDGRELVAAFRSSDDEGGYATEALVFFIRAAIGERERRTAEALFGVLVDRCQRRLRGAIRGVDEDVRAEIQAEVLADLTRLLLSGDDSADFLQSRFWLYLRRRTVTARSEWLRRRARMPLADDLAARRGEDEPPEPTIAGHDLSPEEMSILRDALGRLPPELRELVVLRHYAGWRVGDEGEVRGDAREPTLAERYGITPRAVRKRLARATALLNENRKEEP